MKKPALLQNLCDRDPVYFSIHSHRYRLEGKRDYEFVTDDSAPLNVFTLTDVETGEVTEFEGASAETRLCQYPLAGGATIERDEADFDYLRHCAQIQDDVSFRVIVSSRFSKGFFDRLHAVCQRLGMRLLCETCIPYWKIEGLSEIDVTADHAPELTMEAWEEIFEELFHHKDYHIEEPLGTDGRGKAICRYTTVEETDDLEREAYFVIMGISQV